jgi:hypothetical protein
MPGSTDRWLPGDSARRRGGYVGTNINHGHVLGLGYSRSATVREFNLQVDRPLLLEDEMNGPITTATMCILMLRNAAYHEPRPAREL